MDKNCSRIKVALVEDHEVVRNAIALMLTKIPALEFVFDAANGQEFLEQLKDNPIDVVLLDLEMPVLNGIETLKSLKKQESSIKVIIMTMHKDLEIAFELLSFGADAYLLKECSTREMIEAIECVHSEVEYTNAIMNQSLIHNFAQTRKCNSRADYLSLSQRDLKLLKLICDGFSSSEIADLLSTSKKNVDLLRTKLMKKMKVSSANELIRMAILNKLYTPRSNNEIILELEDEKNESLERRLKNLRENSVKILGEGLE